MCFVYQDIHHPRDHNQRWVGQRMVPWTCQRCECAAASDSSTIFFFLFSWLTDNTHWNPLYVSAESCCCQALCCPFHKWGKSQNSIYRWDLPTPSRHLILTVLLFPLISPSAQSEGLRHRHREHVWVLGCECSLKQSACSRSSLHPHRLR